MDLNTNYLSKPQTVSGRLPAGVRPEHVRLTMSQTLLHKRVDGTELMWTEVRDDGNVGFNAIVEDTSDDGDGWTALRVSYQPVSDNRWLYTVSCFYAYAQPALLALVEAINTRHGAALAVDGIETAGQPKTAVKNGERAGKDLRKRFELFKQIKDERPYLTYEGVAMYATEHHGERLLAIGCWPVYGHDVKNDYFNLAPGEWVRGTRKR